MSEEVLKNLKEPSHWLRILLMLGFAIALYVVGIVLIVLSLAQILFTLIAGADNPNLRHLGAALARYVEQIILFLTYNSDERPFPFAPFPFESETGDSVTVIVTEEVMESPGTSRTSGTAGFTAAGPAAATSAAAAAAAEAQAASDAAEAARQEADSGFESPSDTTQERGQ